MLLVCLLFKFNLNIKLASDSSEEIAKCGYEIIQNFVIYKKKKTEKGNCVSVRY